MYPAATRLIALGAVTFIAASCSHTVKGAAVTLAQATPAPAAAERIAPPVPPRVTPLRPLPAPALAPGVRIGGFDYVSATDIAVWLGLKGAWTEPLRKLTLTDKTNSANQVEIEAKSRNARVNGLRVFLGQPTLLRSEKLYVSRIDVERCLAPLLRPGLGVLLPSRPRIIAIDPGHGGIDDGTENKALGLKEKVLTLDVAFRLKKLLETSGYQVFMTRTGDKELSPDKKIDLPLRALLANRAGADLFVSIHFNAAPKDTRGTEVFWLAPRMERSTDSWSLGAEDDSVTEELPGNRFDHWNVFFTATLHRALRDTLKTEDRGIKMAHWAVLRTLNCPGVLVEPAIISNEGEARRVATPAFRQQIAEALAAGIRDYTAMLDSLRPKPQPAAATVVTPPTSISR